MKTKFGIVIWVVFFMCVCVGADSFAINLGKNITIYDGSSDGTYYHGTGEDHEVEPDSATGQKWDLEGFFFDGSELQVVGGFDFKNGYKGIEIGDIFIDIDGIFDPDSYEMTDDGSVEVTNNFGYEYVLDLDMENFTYNIYDISGGAVTTTVARAETHHSNPYRYVDGGRLIGSGTFTYHSGLSNSDVGGLVGGTHYAMTGFDMDFLDGRDFVVHLTMECGNDNLMGSTAPVPEPATMILLGSGLICLGGMSRKRFKKNDQ